VCVGGVRVSALRPPTRSPLLPTPQPARPFPLQACGVKSVFICRLRRVPPCASDLRRCLGLAVLGRSRLQDPYAAPRVCRVASASHRFPASDSTERWEVRHPLSRRRKLSTYLGTYVGTQVSHCTHIWAFFPLLHYLLSLDRRRSPAAPGCIVVRPVWSSLVPGRVRAGPMTLAPQAASSPSRTPGPASRDGGNLSILSRDNVRTVFHFRYDNGASPGLELLGYPPVLLALYRVLGMSETTRIRRRPLSSARLEIVL